MKKRDNTDLMHGLRLTITMLSVGLILCIIAVKDTLGAITFVTPPFNTSAAVGQNATLACIVSGLEGSDKLKWRRAAPTNTGSAESLTQNGMSLDERYETTGTYNLTIINVTASDERMYTCEISGSTTDSRQAYLTVVELPLNLTVYWETSPRAGTTANLTCFAPKSRPPPTFLWFKDDVKQTMPQYCHTSNRHSGYYDAFSTIQVSLKDSDEGSKFRCQAAYVGWDRAMEYTITTALAGSQQAVYSFSLIAVATLVAALH